MKPLREVKVFVSSPGDVGEERLIVERVLHRLQGEFLTRLQIQPVFWEHEPVRATADYQSQFPLASSCDIVVCILWQRLGTRLPEKFGTKPDGTPWSSGTEFEFEDALRSHRERGLPDLLVFRKTAQRLDYRDDEDLKHRLRQKEALDQFLERWFGNAESGFQAGFTPFADAGEFEAKVEAQLRKLLEQRLPATMRHGEEAVPAWHKGSPFRGLDRFEAEHAAIFFGRTRAISAIRERFLRLHVQGTPFLLLLGASGSGKSSLLRAGVIPTLMHPGVIEQVDVWRLALLCPGEASHHPCAALAVALGKALPELAETGYDQHQLLRLMRESPQLLDQPVQASLRLAAQHALERSVPRWHRSPRLRLLLVIDQLEQLFTMPGFSDVAQQAFVQCVASLVRSGSVWVIAALRSDFYHRGLEIPELAALKASGGQYDLLPPTLDELRQMMVQPARAAGLRFEQSPEGERLDGLLQEAAARHPGALPLLEFTLEQLYRRALARDGETLTFADYHELGGLEGALAHWAEQTFAALPAETQNALADVMAMAVSVSASQQLTLLPVRLDRIPADSPARRLIDALIAARLMTADSTPARPPAARLVHDALLTHWPRLADWVARNHELLRKRDRVEGAFLRWRESGTSKDYLLPHGQPLAEAEELLARLPAAFESQLLDFVKQSRSQARRQRRARRLQAGLLAIFSLALLTVAALGIRHYLLYMRPTITYYRQMTLRWQVVAGVDEISEAEVRRRYSSIRITRRGWKGPVLKAEIIDGYFQWHPLEALLIPAVYHDLTDPDLQAVSVEYPDNQFSEGRIREAVARNRYGYPVWTVIYDEYPSLCHYTFMTPSKPWDNRSGFGRGGNEANLTVAARLGTGQARYAGFEYYLGREGLERQQTYYDADEQGRLVPKPNDLGLYGVYMEYDGAGRNILFINLLLEPLTSTLVEGQNRHGISRIAMTYDPRTGDLLTVRWFRGFVPVISNEGCIGYDYEYDEWGNLRAQHLILPGGLRSDLPGSLARYEFEYGPRGQRLSRSLVDCQGNLIESELIPKTLYEYFPDGRLRSVRFVGADGRSLVLDEQGIAGWNLSYENGQKVCRYVGQDEKPVRHRDGNLGWKVAYVDGRPVSKVYFGFSKGAPCVRLDYDLAGNAVRKRYLKEDERTLMLHPEEGIAGCESHFHNGLEVERRFVGLDGEPKRHADGNMGWTAAYRKDGRLISTTYFGFDEGPPSIKVIYDANGNAIRKRFLDADGRTHILDHQQGIAGWDSRFEGGQEVERRFIGLANEPAWHKDGNLGWKAAYDGQRLVYRTYFGYKTSPFSVREQYDSAGNAVQIRYLDKDDKTFVLHPEQGVAGWDSTFDGHGEASRNYVDAGGRPLAVRTIIDGVEPGSQAESAGVQPGDVFLEYDGVRGNWVALRRAIMQAMRSGDQRRITAVFERKGKEMRLFFKPGWLGVRMHDVGITDHK